MKVFHCGQCGQLVFFENTVCVHCGYKLAYLPDRTEMVTLEPNGKGTWHSFPDRTMGWSYRLCANDTQYNVCNWVVPAEDPNAYCRSCRLTRVIPNLNQAGTQERWAKLETAKRRLIYSLTRLKLPLMDKKEDPKRGLAFEFLANPNPNTPGAKPVLTGHADGVITINVAEADDAEREKRRNAMHEPYRTLLGHFRHEIGHYYWDRLIAGSHHIDGFRRLFGDERADYGEALKRHHQQGAPTSWEASFVSAYASSHPWEDWAETWAHYLHMIDTLETAIACGLSLWPKRSGEPALSPNISVIGWKTPPFDELTERWFALTYVLNNLNRSMGLQDAYPFVLPAPALEKLRFVHEVVG